MSFADSINEQAERTGGKFVTLSADGDKIIGELLGIEERPKTWEGKPVLGQKSGKQRIEWIIELQTDLRDPDNAEDNGIRLVAGNEGVQIAIKKHLKETGQRFPANWGGKLAILVVKGKPAPTQSVEEWSVAYTAPSPADAINAAADAEAVAASAASLI